MSKIALNNKNPHSNQNYQQQIQNTSIVRKENVEKGKLETVQRDVGAKLIIKYFLEKRIVRSSVRYS